MVLAILQIVLGAVSALMALVVMFRMLQMHTVTRRYREEQQRRELQDQQERIDISRFIGGAAAVPAGFIQGLGAKTMGAGTRALNWTGLTHIDERAQAYQGRLAERLEQLRHTQRAASSEPPPSETSETIMPVTPQQCVALTPAEQRLLERTEGTIDRALRRQFTGSNSVRLYLTQAVIGKPRVHLTLYKHYQDAGWTLSVNAAGNCLVFSTPGTITPGTAVVPALSPDQIHADRTRSIDLAPHELPSEPAPAGTQEAHG